MSERLFQPNHERRLLTTFRYVDELVSQSVAKLDAATTASPLSEIVADASPEQQKLAQESLKQLRGLMRRFLEDHQIPPPQQHQSALWQAHTACRHARASVEELQAGSMRGYGRLPPEAERELETLIAALSDVLKKMGDALAPRPDPQG
jgi:hypothetical protein